MAIYNCKDCDYCYSNETMHHFSICVNGESEYCGEPVDEFGLAEEDYDCVVVDGKHRFELDEEEEEEEEDW